MGRTVGTHEVIVFETPEELAVAAAERFVAHAEQAIGDHESFHVALSGGNTPRQTYELLAGESFRDRVEWPLVHIFFVDERCVPHHHPDSNFRLVKEVLLSRVNIPEENVHPIHCEGGEGDPIKNAEAYDAELRSFFADLEWPAFDLVMLGLGEDGHTASLFPGTLALKETHAWAVANRVEKLNSWRITLTAPAINGAINKMFLVTGSKKARALAAVLDGPPDPERLPAQLIKPEDGSLTWLVDTAAAASQLDSRGTGQ